MDCHCSMSDRNFEARSSAAVIVSNSQFFLTSKVPLRIFAALSLVSLFKSKKSALLCCTFLSGVKCSRNKAHYLCNGKALGSRSLTVLVISVSPLFPIAHRNVSLISCSWLRYSDRTSFEFVMIDKSISFVIFHVMDKLPPPKVCAGTVMKRIIVWCKFGPALYMSSHWYQQVAWGLIGCPIMLSPFVERCCVCLPFFD